MPKKMKKGISAPLGLIFGVIIAIILVLLAVFIAFNITSTAVKQTGKTVAVVGTPVVYYNGTNNITNLIFTIANPTAEVVNVTSVIIKGKEVTVNKTVDAKSSTKITVNLTNENIGVNADDINRGYIEFTIVTNVTTIQTVALLVSTK